MMGCLVTESVLEAVLRLCNAKALIQCNIATKNFIQYAG